MRDERLIVLLDAYLDGTLSPDEKRELERMLLQSDAARREFWARSSLHGWIHAAAKLNYGVKPASEMARERRELRGDAFESFIHWLRRVSGVGWKIALGAGACVAVMMLWLGIRSLQPMDDDMMVDTGPEPAAKTNLIARVTRGSDVVWDGETNAVDIGSAVASQWLRLKSGALQIEFYSGARVILEGPAAFELISPVEARLDFGKLTAHVPEPAHGFRIYTADATVTDLGTAFGLNCPKAQPAQLEVFEGKVEVATESTNEPRLLTAGEGVEVADRKMGPLPADDHLDFMSPVELARRESTELQARFKGWKVLSRSLDYDPATLVHFDFEDAHDVERNLVNRAPGARVSSRATIMGCDWGEGRWPGKSALEFNSDDDLVRLAVPGKFQSLTYMAWLRVDSLANQWNTLALVDTLRSGETHWEILRDGRVDLAVRVKGGKAAWDHLISPPIITRDYFGKWIQLAAVYDGAAGQMSLYLNGKLVAAKPAERRELTLGTLELGNWTPVTQKPDAKYRIRDFHGRMDEFALLSRPLSTQEIHRLYEIGKPRGTTVVAGVPPSSFKE